MTGIPRLWTIVWMNYPDHDDEPEGRVVGYTQDFGSQEGDHRYDQPVILGPKHAPIFGPDRGRPPASAGRVSETTVGAVYRRVADEHRETIERAREIVAREPYSAEYRVASALVAIDEAMRSELTNDR